MEPEIEVIYAEATIGHKSRLLQSPTGKVVTLVKISVSFYIDGDPSDEQIAKLAANLSLVAQNIEVE